MVGISTDAVGLPLPENWKELLEGAPSKAHQWYTRPRPDPTIHPKEYIGETMTLAKPLTNAIRRALRMPLLRDLYIVYYGKPDAHLRRKFGYPTT